MSPPNNRGVPYEKQKKQPFFAKLEIFWVSIAIAGDRAFWEKTNSSYGLRDMGVFLWLGYLRQDKIKWFILGEGFEFFEENIVPEFFSAFSRLRD